MLLKHKWNCIPLLSAICKIISLYIRHMLYVAYSIITCYFLLFLWGLWVPWCSSWQHLGQLILELPHNLLRQVDSFTVSLHSSAYKVKGMQLLCTFNIQDYIVISMPYCKTAVTPLLTHWSYCSLAWSHHYMRHIIFHDNLLFPSLPVRSMGRLVREGRFINSSFSGLV